MFENEKLTNTTIIWFNVQLLPDTALLDWKKCCTWSLKARYI